MIDNSFVRNLEKYALIDVNRQLNWCWEIKDPELRKDFHAYSFYKRSSVFIIAYSFFLIFIALPIETAIFADIMKEDVTLSEQLLTFGFYIILLIYILSNLFFLFAKRLPWLYQYDLLNNTVFIISMTLIVILRLIRYSYYPCSISSWVNYIIGKHCTSDYNDIMPWDAGAYLLAPSITYITIIKETRFVLVGFCYFAILATIITLISIETVPSFVNIVFWAIIGVCLIIDLHIQMVKTYLLKRKLIETLVNNENHQDENTANEMRSIIANVAHDLKTPLSSLSMGLDIIEHILHECEDNCRNSSMTIERFFDKLESLWQYFDDLRNTNHIMLMAINRCIDYTKASKGMALVPDYETINLFEALTWPIHCIRKIQSRINIQLKPLPKVICSHIITDKQWLQENLLCLLSNAVKYSTQGSVTISVKLDYQLTDSEKTFKESNPLKLMLVPQSHPSPTGLSPEVCRIVPINKSTERMLSSPETFNPSSSDANNISSKYREIEMIQENMILRQSDETTLYNEKVPEPNELIFLRFEIEDQGIGISEEQAKCLFTPFKQAQRYTGGTGLGLYSLAKRVEALNGHYGIKPRSDGKRGSLFWFKIPYKPDRLSALMAEKTPPTTARRLKSYTDDLSMPQYTKERCLNNENFPIPSPISTEFSANDNKAQWSVTTPVSGIIPVKPPPLTETQNNQGKLTILIVDDSPMILKMTGIMLKRQGHDICTAENGEIALKLIQERWRTHGRCFDLVLMDLQMPIMDGLEATRRLRYLEQESKEITDFLLDHRPHQVIIGCSANSDKDTMNEAIKAGIDQFIPKPFTIESFQMILQGLAPKITSKLPE